VTKVSDKASDKVGESVTKVGEKATHKITHKATHRGNHRGNYKATHKNDKRTKPLCSRFKDSHGRVALLVPGTVLIYLFIRDCTVSGPYPIL